MVEDRNELAVKGDTISAVERVLQNYDVDPRIYPVLQQMGVLRWTAPQYLSIIYGLFERKSLLVCAATSAGKTLIGEIACINTILTKKKRCLYLAPLKSLASEKFRNFQKRWGTLGVKVEISTGDMNIFDRKAEEEKLKTTDLLITTYERADSILRSNTEWFGTVGVVVVDEVHNVGSSSRGARLEGVLIRLREYFPSIQFIYLSATVGNPEELAEWLDAEFVNHEHRPVPLEYKIVQHSSRNNKIKEIVRETLQQRGSVLVFTPTRYEAEELCGILSQYFKDKELLYLVKGRELRAVVNQLHDEIGTRFDRRLFFSIPRGVAFHHAGLSKTMRGFVEEQFRQGLIRVITSTPTLSSGVNLPAKVVVIKDVCLTRTYLQIKTNRLHQMCGRAGRPGYDDKGTAIILAQQEGEKSDIEIIYFESHSLHPKYAPVESQFMNQSNLLEQYLVWIAETPGGIREADLEYLTFKTFWYAFTRKRQPDATIQHLTTIGHYSLENLLIRHSTPHILQNARSIPDSAVKIRQMSRHKLEGIIYDRFHIKCSFSRDHPDCGCGGFNSRNARHAPVCRHLVKLAQVSYKRNPAYVKDMLLAAFHEEQLVDKLLKDKMIKILNTRLQVTDFGKQTVLLYLKPETAAWIRSHLPKIRTKEQFYYDLLYAFKMERRFRVKANHQEILEQLFDEDYVDLDYHIDTIINEYRIHPGDMEEFIETLRWMIHCFHTLAELDGMRTVLNFTQHAIDKLFPVTSSNSADRSGNTP